MFNLLKSNIREIITLILVFSAMLFGLGLLGDKAIADGPHSELVALTTSLLVGVLRFSVVLVLAWFGLAITFPEAGKLVFSKDFDGFWRTCPYNFKMYISLIAAAVLLIAAALCMP